MGMRTVQRSAIWARSNTGRLTRITIKGAKITCNHSLINDIERQVSTLNLMCDLAELAEKLGSESANSDARRN
jgi:hypothetical protein